MKVTSRANLVKWLDALTGRYTVIAPRLLECALVYRPVSSSAEVVFDFERTAFSPKAFFLPETQVILEATKRGKEVVLSEPSMEREQVIFGLRPCDARSLRALDTVLLDRPPPDTYYAERRQKTTLIGLACPQLWDGCFCTSLGGGPDDASDVDLMLYEGEAEYWIVETTGRGAALAEGLVAKDTEQPAPASKATGRRVPVPPAEEWRTLFDDEYWHRLAERCLSCHACTYVCPTCRCFDVRDDVLRAGAGYSHVQRLRAWDSCMASAYRRIAGGHNPRPATAQRLRNRYYCKFYYSPQDFGTVACVGCGRCIEVCPVGIDIFEMLGDVAGLGG